MDRRRRSKCWTLFTKLEAGKAKCDLCGQVLSFLGGATSNLTRHIKIKHPGANLSRQDECKAREEQLPTPSSNNITQPPSSGHSTNQAMITHLLKRPISVQKNNQLDNQLARMMTKELQPLSLVEDKEFKKFLKMLNPSYSLPSRKTVSSVLIPQLYSSTVERIKNELKPIKAISITTDGWTSITNDSFLAVTAHFLNEECELKSCLLDCFQYNEKNSADNLAKELKRVLSEWEVIDKITVVVSDNTENIKDAIKICNWRHIPCFAHTISLIVWAGITEINPTQLKVKSVVEFFRRSAQATSKLRNFQKQMGFKILKLKEDVPARWNSTYQMFARFLELKEPLLSTLALVNPQLNQFNEKDWVILEKACNILEVFKEVSVELSSVKYVSLSKVIVVRKALMMHVDEVCQENDLPDEIKSMASILNQQLSFRFTDIEANPVLADSTILDPRFKKEVFQSETSLKHVCRSLQERVASMQCTTNVHCQDNEATCSRYLQPSTSALWKAFDISMTPLYHNANPTALGVIELDKYLQEPHILRTEDPLLWWIEQKNVYPHLYQIMKSRLSIPATSVPCERLFSKGGQLLTDRRNRLSSSKVAQIMFLNVNM